MHYGTITRRIEKQPLESSVVLMIHTDKGTAREVKLSVNDLVDIIAKAALMLQVEMKP